MRRNNITTLAAQSIGNIEHIGITTQKDYSKQLSDSNRNKKVKYSTVHPRMIKGYVERKVVPELSNQLVTWKRKQQSWLLDRKLGIIINNNYYLQWELLFLTNEVMKWKEMVRFLENQLSSVTHNIMAGKTKYGQDFQNLIDAYNEQLNENNLVISILKSRPRLYPFPIYLHDEVCSHIKSAITELDSLIIISLISLVFLWVSVEV